MVLVVLVSINESRVTNNLQNSKLLQRNNYENDDDEKQN